MLPKKIPIINIFDIISVLKPSVGVIILCSSFSLLSVQGIGWSLLLTGQSPAQRQRERERVRESERFFEWLGGFETLTVRIGTDT